MLDPGQVAGEVRYLVQRVRQQVNVLRHEDECGQSKAFFLAGRIQGTGQPAAPVVVGQQRTATVAGERELVQVSRLVIMPHEFAMGQDRLQNAYRRMVASCHKNTGKARGTRRGSRQVCVAGQQIPAAEIVVEQINPLVGDGPPAGLPGLGEASGEGPVSTFAQRVYPADGGPWAMRDEQLMNDTLLLAYLNDHLAGSVIAIEMGEHCRDNHATPALAAFLDGLLGEIESDRTVLKDLIGRLGGDQDTAKKSAAWLGEKAGRLKLRGDEPAEVALSRLEQLEVLMLGIRGKLGLWDVLERLSAKDERLRSFDWANLRRSAADQVERVDGQRIRAAQEAFLPAGGS